MNFTITTRHEAGDVQSERTEYIQPDRRRGEYPVSEGPRVVLITRCDRGLGYRLNLDDREFSCFPLPHYPTDAELRATGADAMLPADPPKPTVIVETTTVDTGERKEAFGFTARRVIVTCRHIPLTDASRPQETTEDGWYIDLDPTISCERWWPTDGPRGHVFLSATITGDEAPEIPQFTDIGAPETGFAIELESVEVSRDTLPDGTTKEFRHSWTTRVTALSTEPIDARLFEVPEGFREVE